MKHPSHNRRRLALCGVALTPANAIGMALFFFFVCQFFTASPFESFTRGSPATGEVSDLDADDGQHSGGGVWFLGGGGGGGGGSRLGMNSHAYLRRAFWDHSPLDFVANVSAWYDESVRQQGAGQPSLYSSWIQRDLAPWNETGISRDLVEASAQLYDECDGEMVRFQVLNGSLWVHHVTDRGKQGWYPAILGPGNVAAKGRVPYAMLAVMDALRLFPGQIPDVDAVLHTADFPCVQRAWDAAAGGAPPLPLLGFQGSAAHWDIPWPDYTFHGNEYQYLQDPWGHRTQGWAAQEEVLARKYANVSLRDRVPQAMWRGRTRDERYPARDELRRQFVGCVDRLQRQRRPQDAALLSVVRPPVALQDTCDYRYNVYIESEAYASNLKQKLACGSVLVALHMEFHEWWSRALQAGTHFVDVANDGQAVCDQMVQVVRDMNAMLDSPTGRGVLPSGTGATPTLEQRLADLRRDRQLSRHLGLGGGGSWLGRAGALFGEEAAGEEETTPAPAPGAGGNYSWGSALMPWEVAANGQRFVREHVRMADALVYIRDLLRAYAALQQFKPKPAAKSQCYTGARLLEQFGTPHEADAAAVARAYPWLQGYDAGCAAAEAQWGSF